MFHARDNLTKIYGKKALEVLNSLAKFANALCAGNCMQMKKPDDPSESNPVSIGLDVDAASTAIADKFKSDPGSCESLVSGYKAKDGGSGYTSSTGKLGYNKDTFDTSSEGYKGLEIMIATRICTDGEAGPLVFRKFRFNHLGMLVKVEEESSACGVYTDS